MKLASQKEWFLGQFLISADNRFVARQAYELLRKNEGLMNHSGSLKLPYGRQVEWTNIARRQKRSLT